MMKNRDTASNPYRVPKQPTPRWIKVSIVGLFLSNVALFGVVVFLVFSAEQCTKICRGAESGKADNAEKQAPPSKSLPRDQAESQIEEQQDSIRLVTRRVNQIEHTLTSIKASVKNQDRCCGKGISETAVRSLTPSVHPTFNTLVPVLGGLPAKVATHELRLSDLEEKVTLHIESSKQLCQNRHFRYGMHCYYVGEARLAEGSAMQFCANDFGVRGTLAIVKDKFTHDFITSKLSNRLHSYWIGIKRQGQLPDSWASREHHRAELIKEDGGKVPSPLSADSTDGPFDYVDGTKVQDKVWEMWGPKANRNENRQRRNCVALSYDTSNEEWYWQDHDCESRLGYICQYFVMGIGY